MAEPGKQQMGDGSDSYGNAARQTANAVKQVGKNAAKETAKKGAEATVNAAANTVKAGIKTGKAVSEIAAGTAAGGPVGAILSAAWSMRHTLFKILICVCLAVLFVIVTVISIPDILLRNIKNVFQPDAPDQTSVVQASYMDLAAIVTASIEQGHRNANAEIERIISDGGYDRSLSLANITDLSVSTKEHDICSILAAYSVATEKHDVSRENLVYRLNQATEQMFPVTYEVMETHRTVVEGETMQDVTVYYIASTIHPFHSSAVYEALLIDVNANYGDTGMTYGEVIDFYTKSLENILNIGG